MKTKKALTTAAFAIIVACCSQLFGAVFDLPQEMEDDIIVSYIKELLQENSLEDSDIRFSVSTQIKHREGFLVRKDKETIFIEAASPAGMLYGLQEYMINGASGKPEQPDFKVRAHAYAVYTASCNEYEDLKSSNYPAFYNREIMIRYLDHLFASRLNTVMLWSPHIFNGIMELPEYPEAQENISKEELRRNIDHFRWLINACAKRNISVLLGTFQIIVPDGVKEKAIAKGYDENTRVVPNPYTIKYTQTVMTRFMEEFPAVGLYVCNGEKIGHEYKMDWARDVILSSARKAAEKTGSLPLIVMRKHYMETKWLAELSDEYENFFTEMKHNKEGVLGTVPVAGHKFLLDAGIKQHLINLHLPGNIKPFRWGDPEFIQEMVINWKNTGITGAELYSLTFHRYPYATDKVDVNIPPMRWPENEGDNLFSFDRDQQYLRAFGRYLWKTERPFEEENAYWKQFFAQKYGSDEVGEEIQEWYKLITPIMPTLQNIAGGLSEAHATGAMGPSIGRNRVMSLNQLIQTDRLWHEWICPAYHTIVTDYQRKYDVEELDDLRPLKLRQYLELLSGNEKITYKGFSENAELGFSADKDPDCSVETTIDRIMTPDKVISVCKDRAERAIEIAEKAVQAERTNSKEIQRYVSDARAISKLCDIYSLWFEAGLEKGLALNGKGLEHQAKAIEIMEELTREYEKFVTFISDYYYAADDSWHFLNREMEPNEKNPHWKNALPELDKYFGEEKELYNKATTLDIPIWYLNDEHYTSIHWHYNRTNVPALMRFESADEVEARREKLKDFIFDKEDVLTTAYPQYTKEIIHEADYDDIAYLIEKITLLNYTTDHDVNSVIYYFKSKNPSGKLVIYHQGHSGDFVNGKKTIAGLLEAGCDVVALSMSLLGKNRQPFTQVPGLGRLRLTNHGWLSLLDKPFKYFMEPIAAGINYATNEKKYSSISMVGLSGGAWSITLFAAIDERADNIYQVGGTMPMFLRSPTEDGYKGRLGDWENHSRALLKQVNMLEIYILGSMRKNRHHYQIINQFDVWVAAHGVKYRLYEKHVQDKLEELGGASFSVILDEKNPTHSISTESLEFIRNDINKNR